MKPPGPSPSWEYTICVLLPELWVFYLTRLKVSIAICVLLTELGVFYLTRLEVSISLLCATAITMGLLPHSAEGEHCHVYSAARAMSLLPHQAQVEHYHLGSTTRTMGRPPL